MTTTVDESDVRGTVAAGFEPVLDAFQTNLAERGELGGAVAVHRGDELVVDLWGGARDAAGTPWERDTRSLVFSTSKGLVAVCVGLLVQRGMVELDAPVARYWPEFAAAGKDAVTVAMLLDHTAGLPTVEAGLTRAQVLAWDPVVEALAAQAPLWRPGHGIGYHAVTYGFLLGELVRRVTGSPVQEFLATEVSGPLAVGTSFGVGSDPAPVARKEPALPAPADAPPSEVARLLAEIIETRPFFLPSLNLGGALPFPGFGGDETYNDADVLHAVLPAVNAVSTARDLSRVYAACVGEVDGVRLLLDGTVEAMRRRPDRAALTEPAPLPLWQWGLGFMLDPHPVRPMFGPGSFGHDGADGSMAFACTRLRASFSYITSRMGGVPDDRGNALAAAARAILEG